MHESDRRTALVVHESMFGNTAAVAEAVRRGLELAGFEARAVPVAAAPRNGQVPADLLVVGAPTHALSLSRPATRRSAVEQGAPEERAQTGLREWLGSLDPVHAGTGRLAATFDTRHQRVRHLPTSAARAAGRLLGRRGFVRVARPRGFLVTDVRGPLLEGELEQAVAWGRELGRRAQDRLAADGVRVPGA